MTAFEDVRKAFMDYAISFHQEDGRLAFPTRLKIGHTDEVCRITNRIAERTKLEPHTVLLCRYAALFHDLARFEQYDKFKTFRDDQSFDHGDRSAELLMQDGYLDFLPEEDLQIVLDSVRVHNKIQIPDDFPENALIPAKMVRDADKLSIFRILVDFLALPEIFQDPSMKLDLPDTQDFSESVLDHALEGKMIARHELHSVNDFKITLFAWVNDLNFPASAEYVLERNYYPRLRSYLPDLPKVNMLMERTMQELARRSAL